MYRILPGNKPAGKPEKLNVSYELLKEQFIQQFPK
jgi:hypothetical protein